MKRLLLLIPLMLASCGATMRVNGHAPANDNNGTCAAPVLLTNQSAFVVMHFQWQGPDAGEDSISVATGAAFSFSRSVRAGSYTIRAWASDAGGVGCDTTITRA